MTDLLDFDWLNKQDGVSSVTLLLEWLAPALAQHDAEVARKAKAATLREAAEAARAAWAPYPCPWVGFLDDLAHDIDTKEAGA